jgi:hypothetical protein
LIHISETLEGASLAFRRWVNVTFRNRHAAMTRDLLNREGVCTSLTESRQKSVAQRVYHAVIWQLQIVPKLPMEMVEPPDVACRHDSRTDIQTCSQAICLPTSLEHVTSDLHGGVRSSICLHKRRDNRALGQGGVHVRKAKAVYTGIQTGGSTAGQARAVCFQRGSGTRDPAGYRAHLESDR